MATKNLTLMPSAQGRKCSFCGQPESEVNVLIHSRGNFICDHCVKEINELLKDDEEKESA
jgi:ATP-dependent protease Clp ATPase subunit